MSELKPYVTGSNEGESRRERIEVEKIGACLNMFLARNPERRRSSATCNHEKLRRKLVSVRAESLGPDESTYAMVCVDSELSIGGFLLGRHRFGKRALEFHESWPVESCLAPYA